MKTWVRKTLSVGVLAAGALLFAPSAVHADTAQVSIDNNGIANGNQAYAPIQIPVNVCGNGVGVVGVGVGLSGACVNGAAQDVDHWSKSSRKKESSRTEDTLQFSWGNDGIANGNQAYVPVQVPVNVCGNGVGVVGVGVGLSGICVNHAAQDVDVKESKRTEDTAQISSDNDGILNGNQIYVPIQVPINVCGNGVGVVGVGVGISGACFNSAVQDVDHGGKKSHKGESSRTEDTLQWSGDNDGILNGNQIYVPIQVPINVCGNGVGVVGVGVGVSGACFNGAVHDADFNKSRKGESSRTEDTAQISGDNDGILNGNQIYVPIQVPINVCGNGVGVVGVGVGISGACLNGAAQDVDVNDDHKGNQHYKGKDKGGDHGYYKKKEALPLVGGLAGTLTGGLPTGGLPTGGLPTGGDTSSLPIAGDLGSGVKTSKVNVGGVDPMGLLNQVPA